MPELSDCRCPRCSEGLEQRVLMRDDKTESRVDFLECGNCGYSIVTGDTLSPERNISKSYKNTDSLAVAVFS